MNKVKEIVDKVKKLINHFGQRVFARFPVLKKVGHLLQMLSPSRYIGILDWYIIKKFIGTYIYAILLIISIAIVFDFNENLSKFTQYHAPCEQSSLITMPIHSLLFQSLLTTIRIHCSYLLYL